jgi:general secretion pathway protein D
MNHACKAFIGAVLLALAACAADPVSEARRQVLEGRGEEALASLERAMKAAPGDLAARSEYFRLRDTLLSQWLAQADALRAAGEYEAAGTLYRKAQGLDPANARARAGLAQADADRRHRVIVEAAEKLAKEENFRDAQDALRPVLVENPAQRDARRLQRMLDEKLSRPALAQVRLKGTLAKPISVDLRDVTVRALFDVLARTSGISFVFDRDVRGDQRTTLTVRDQGMDEVLRLALMSNQLEQKIVNETTVLVFPNTPQKLREYQELVVKTFYIANADVRQTANMIRALVKTRDLFVDEKLNLIVMKDTPSAVRLAERLIATQDLAEPEVVLEVEVIEIGYNKLLELGLRFPSSIGWSLVGGGAAAATGTPGVLSLQEWNNRNAGLVRLTVTNPLFLLSLRQQDGATSVLANPRIRVKNREKARIHIGDRVPVITTTAAAAGGFVSESVSYLDVGLKLEVEPLIYLDDEVGIKVALEVSTIVQPVNSKTGTNTLAYQIGTRNAATSLRLRDGETQILAGLINDEDRRTADRVPGLGELPLIGRLFSSTSDDRKKTDIMLLITPRLVRTLAVPGANAVEFAAGTEASTSGGAAGGPVLPQTFTPPPAAAPPAAAPAATPPLQPFSLQPFSGPQPGPALNTPPATDMVPFGGVRPPTQ